MFNQPQQALEGLSGPFMIDEIQLVPNLSPLLRCDVDYRLEQSYLILGSALRDLSRQSYEISARRIACRELGGFGLQDPGTEHWFRCVMPRSFLASSDEISALWRQGYIAALIHRQKMLASHVSKSFTH